jgi:hypothetical protein
MTRPAGAPTDGGVARVFTPPWNKKRLPPGSPHGTRHAAAVNAAAANAASCMAEASRTHAGAEGARSPLSPQRGPYERGLAHATLMGADRAPSRMGYPVVSLSTQMAQVCARRSVRCASWNLRPAIAPCSGQAPAAPLRARDRLA